MGITRHELSASFFNWWLHLARSPTKQLQLIEKAAHKVSCLAITTGEQILNGQADPCIQPLERDTRFDAREWQRWPFNVFYQNFLLTRQWWDEAARDIDGLSRHDEQAVSFAARQGLDMMSPSNSLWTNPEVIAQTMREGGVNLIRGAQNLSEDWERVTSGKPPVGAEDFIPGRDVSLTPGKVVFRSHLLELIQYAPRTTATVSEPIMIVPAWILKYYILDLSPHNSLVRYMVEQGFTVFMVSWRNPDAEDRDLGMSDYFDALGEALNAVGEIVPDTHIHAIGYCLGGMLLSAKAAQMARDHDERLKTLTFLAAQTDFENPGELQLFIGERDITALERLMSDQGYLDSKPMVDAVKILQSGEVIWPNLVRNYLMGQRQEIDAQNTWSIDSTRMPYRMYSEYLRRIYINNELARGHYEVAGEPVAIRDIAVPVFCVSAIDDVVAPWLSVYKLHLLANTDITFVLTSGDHIDGIVNGPDEVGPSYQIAATPDPARYVASADWRAQTPQRDGTWWPELVTWLRSHSTGTGKPPQMGVTKALADAPGTYVFQH